MSIQTPGPLWFHGFPEVTTGLSRCCGFTGKLSNLPKVEGNGILDNVTTCLCALEQHVKIQPKPFNGSAWQIGLATSTTANGWCSSQGHVSFLNEYPHRMVHLLPWVECPVYSVQSLGPGQTQMGEMEAKERRICHIVEQPFLLLPFDIGYGPEYIPKCELNRIRITSKRANQEVVNTMSTKLGCMIGLQPSSSAYST